MVGIRPARAANGTSTATRTAYLPNFTAYLPNFKEAADDIQRLQNLDSMKQPDTLTGAEGF